MKTVPMVLSGLILLAAQVSLAKPVLVSDADAKNIKAGMNLYYFDCGNYDASNIQLRIQKFPEVYVDDSGAQPVLSFVGYSAKRDGRNQISVTTDATLTKPVELRFKYESMTSVNRGTILKPRIVQEFVTKQDFTCDTFKLK